MDYAGVVQRPDQTGLHLDLDRTLGSRVCKFLAIGFIYKLSLLHAGGKRCALNLQLSTKLQSMQCY